jgi:IclR family acetate operon transcriptional repressor
MRSLERALDVLAVLQRHRRPLRLTEVARDAELHLATAQRILNALARSGYVQQVNSGYTLGITSLLNAHAFLVSDELSLIATPVLQELSTTSGLTASLSVRVGWSQVLLVRIEGARPLRYQLPVGEQLSLHLGGARVLAAGLRPDELTELIDSLGEIRLASGDTLSGEEFRAALDLIRLQGYAAGVSQRELGAASVAVPVYGREGSLRAALQLSGRADDFEPTKLGGYVAELTRASAAITRRIP